jgi:hypothetical protein
MGTISIRLYWAGDDNDPAFLYHYCGNRFALDEIEAELTANPPALDHGPGTYSYECQKTPAQTGEFGRVELAAYWSFALVSFEQLEGGEDEQGKS